jgi:hypothetical protein
MKVRQLKRRGQEMLGHYEVHSSRIRGWDNNPFGDLSWRECRRSFRSRVGVSRSRPWRKHV